ncbi:MAG TPA: radical SAM protein [bacterium]|nr:radical SAM protein [Myxococcales bacterium]OQA61950.1 MAG: Spore photoproduct lyase [bacterium ADurb.Bin270]HPW44886.1 radical SAM protein [bacterium]HQC50225.1 radical SAM protein [bacterium]HQG13778.1 radical SAM protein [bacterium]
MSTVAHDSKVRRLPSRKIKTSAFPFTPEHVWIDASVADHPQTIRIMNKLKDIEVDIVDDVRTLKRPTDAASAKNQMVLTAHKGQAFKLCQGIGEGHLCCNYRVLDLVSGCPMECSYCILQSYLYNNPRTTVYVNVEEILAEVSAFLAKEEGKFFRIGTGELGDSLALDPITESASLLVPFFASKKNAILELKTKSLCVDSLMELRHRNRTVVSWSINTPAYIASEERNTSSLEERLEAAAKVSSAGYGVGFHFDPIIIIKDATSEIQAYLDVVDKIFEKLEPRQISWISLGLLRFPKDLSRIASRRFPDTKIYTGEFVPSNGKMRYLRFIREDAYRPLYEKLLSKLPRHKVYLCMETPTVWEKIDPDVKCNSCIEKRLCNAESISFDYKRF